MSGMALAAISSFFTTGTLVAAPLTALSIIPLLAIGINFYRYQSVDPEARPFDAEKVCVLDTIWRECDELENCILLFVPTDSTTL